MCLVSKNQYFLTLSTGTHTLQALQSYWGKTLHLRPYWPTLSQRERFLRDCG